MNKKNFLFIVVMIILQVSCNNTTRSDEKIIKNDPVQHATSTPDHNPQSYEDLQKAKIQKLKEFFGDSYPMMSDDCDRADKNHNERRNVYSPAAAYYTDAGKCMNCVNQLIYRIYLNDRVGIPYYEEEFSYVDPQFGSSFAKSYNPEWTIGDDGKLYIDWSDENGFYIYKNSQGKLKLYSKYFKKDLDVGPSPFRYIPSEMPYCELFKI